MIVRSVVAIALVLGTAGCGDSSQPSSSSSSAQSTADKLTGDAAGAAQNNPICKLFTASELEAYVGEPLGNPQNAVGGSACQWPSKDDQGDVMIQIVPESYLVAPTGDSTYKPLPDLGPKGYVVHQYDGWAAGAVVGTDGIMASVAGQSASPATAEALLREVIKRRAR